MGGRAGDAHARAQPLWTSDARAGESALVPNEEWHSALARLRRDGVGEVDASTRAALVESGFAPEQPCFIVGPRCHPRCQQPPPPTPAEALSRVCLAALPDDGETRLSAWQLEVPANLDAGYTSGYNGSVGARDSDAGATGGPTQRFGVPAVIGIGPAKSASTGLFGMLYRHPVVPEPVKPPKAGGAGGIFEPGHFTSFDHIFSMGLPHLASYFPVVSGPAAMDERERVARGKGLRERVQMDALSARAIADHVGSRVTSDATHRLAAMHAAAVAVPRKTVTAGGGTVATPAAPEPTRGAPLFAEKSPWYISHPLAPYRLHATLPGALAVATLRDPVERAFSGFVHTNKNRFARGLGPLMPFNQTVEMAIAEVERYRTCRDATWPTAAASAGAQADTYHALFTSDGVSTRTLQEIDEQIWYACGDYAGFDFTHVRNRFSVRTPCAYGGGHRASRALACPLLRARDRAGSH